jgi:hypothetical protein
MLGLTYGSEGSQIKLKNNKNFVILKADKKNMNTKVPAPLTLNKKTGNQATFIVNYNGFSSQAQSAFQHAIDIWSSILTSTVPIRIEATWDSLGANVLGSASAATFLRDFVNAPKNNTWYSIALAEKFMESSYYNNPDSAAIKAYFNNNFSHWYFGTDGNCPTGKYDFVSVVLHELCHGLGFQGSMDINGGQGSWGFASGFPFIFDQFTEDGSGQSLLNTSIYPNPSTNLANVLTSNNVYFNGTVANSVNGYSPVKLFAPAVWETSSSYSHLSETTYPAGTPNSLMTPTLGAAEAIHNPGNITLGIFEDIGWTTNLVKNTTMVYPGDTDNNGTVNEMDILPIGVYFLEQGGARQEISFAWGAKETIIWSDTAATFADANGDGTIDEKDLIGIGVNWGNSHTTNSNSYEINFENTDLLMKHKENFKIIYNSISRENSQFLEIIMLLNKIFSFDEEIPLTFSLDQNYPNPFNPVTNIRFVLPEKQKISLKVFNSLGQVVSEPIIKKTFDVGVHNIKFEAEFLSNGVYVYSVISDKYKQSRKMIILK